MQPLDFQFKDKTILPDNVQADPKEANKDDLEAFDKAMQVKDDNKAENSGTSTADSNDPTQSPQSVDATDNAPQDGGNMGTGEAQADTSGSASSQSPADANAQATPNADGTPTQTAPQGGQAHVLQQPESHRAHTRKEHDRIDRSAAAQGNVHMQGVAVPTTAPVSPSQKAEAADAPRHDSIEQMYKLIDRILVNDPQFQDHRDDPQVILQLKGEFFENSRLRLKRTQEGLSVVVEADTAEAAAHFTPDQLNLLQQRLESHPEFARKVQVKLKRKEEED